jgi:hypothetical protein
MINQNNNQMLPLVVGIFLQVQIPRGAVSVTPLQLFELMPKYFSGHVK